MPQLQWGPKRSRISGDSRRSLVRERSENESEKLDEDSNLEVDSRRTPSLKVRANFAGRIERAGTGFEVNPQGAGLEPRETDPSKTERIQVNLKKLVIFFSIFLFLVPPAWSKSSINVPVEDPVYRDLDRILAAGLVKNYIYGQRPYTREEVVRLLTEARENLDKKEKEILVLDPRTEFYLDLREVLDKRLAEYQSFDEKHEDKNFYWVPLDRASLDVTLLDSPTRSVPQDNGVGSISAVINPLVQYQGGRHYVEGGTLGIETEHWAQISPYFSAFAHPRFALLTPTTGSTKGEAIVQELYGKGGIGNFEVEIGRDSLVWGQSPQGSFLLSTNARPLDIIKISNPHPLKLPWIFKHFGNFKGTFFLANLGPERSFKNDFLAGIHLSLQPHPLIELGLSSIFNFGGQGSPALSFSDGIRDFFGFIPFGGFSNVDLGANRIAGVEGSFRIPSLHDMQLYLEMYIDDKSDASFRALFIDGNAYLAGLYLPRLVNSGLLDLRLETRWASPIFHRHGIFTDGHTLNSLLLGDPMGPNAWSITGTSKVYVNPESTFSLELRYEYRDSNTYIRDAINHLVSDNPNEERLGLTVNWHQEWSQHWLSSIKFGYERVNHLNFAPGIDKDNFLGHFWLTYHY